MLLTADQIRTIRAAAERVVAARDAASLADGSEYLELEREADALQHELATLCHPTHTLALCEQLLDQLEDDRYDRYDETMRFDCEPGPWKR